VPVRRALVTVPVRRALMTVPVRKIAQAMLP